MWRHLGGSAAPSGDAKLEAASPSILLRSSKGLLDPPMSPWPGPNAGCNILRRCAPPETRDSDHLLRLLHKSRSDVKPPHLLRGFAFQNGGDVRLHRGGDERRG